MFLEKIVASRYMQSLNSTTASNSTSSVNNTIKNTDSKTKLKSTQPILPATNKQQQPSTNSNIVIPPTSISKNKTIKSDTIIPPPTRNEELSTTSSKTSTSSETTPTNLFIELQLLYSQLLQWTYINAIVIKNTKEQESIAQQILYDKWSTLLTIHKQYHMLIKNTQNTLFQNTLSESINLSVRSNLVY